MAKMLPPDWRAGWPHVWLGTTTEDEANYRLRWPVLACVPAARRFISYEPALGPLRIAAGPCPDWIIIGAESGPGARSPIRNGCATCWRMRKAAQRAS